MIQLLKAVQVASHWNLRHHIMPCFVVIVCVSSAESCLKHDLTSFIKWTRLMRVSSVGIIVEQHVITSFPPEDDVSHVQWIKTMISWSLWNNSVFYAKHFIFFPLSLVQYGTGVHTRPSNNSTLSNQYLYDIPLFLFYFLQALSFIFSLAFCFPFLCLDN